MPLTQPPFSREVGWSENGETPACLPRKVCNTLKLFCGCCFGRSNNNKFSDYCAFLLRFSCVPCGLLQIDFIIVFTPACHAPSLSLPLFFIWHAQAFGVPLFVAGFPGCWRFENWLRTHDYLTHTTHFSLTLTLECTNPPDDCLINFIMS